MRIIEQRMNAAILAKKSWQQDNTRVYFDEMNNVSEVYLHDNKIAEVGDNFIRLYDGGHQTKTTKSRLNAILYVHGLNGERVYQKNYEWLIDLRNQVGELITVPFFSSMRLA